MIRAIGGCLGLGAGIGIAEVLQHIFPEFPFRPPSWAILAALSVSCSVGLLFGFLPARDAARLDPVAALMRRKA